MDKIARTVLCEKLKHGEIRQPDPEHFWRAKNEL